MGIKGKSKSSSDSFVIFILKYCRFWGDAVHNAGAGPAPIPFKKLTTEKIVSAIRFAISAEASHAAAILGEKIRAEKGETEGVNDFHRNLSIDALV